MVNRQTYYSALSKHSCFVDKPKAGLLVNLWCFVENPEWGLTDNTGSDYVSHRINWR